MKASKVDIKNELSRLRKIFNRADPLIDGCNFFTGEYVSAGGLFGSSATDENDLNSFWRGLFVAEQREVAEKLAEDLTAFTEGSRERITILPITRLKRKMEFSGWRP